MSKELIDLLAEACASIPEHMLDHDAIVESIRYANEAVPSTAGMIESALDNGFASGGFTGPMSRTGPVVYVMPPGEIVIPLPGIIRADPREKDVPPLDNADNNG